MPVRALRVTYVGELGWELYCPTEYGLGAVARRSGRRAQPHGLVAGGYRAIDSLRLEKGYRVWGADITPDETPYEGGLGFCVKLDKEFVGREALERAREAGAGARLCCLALEDPRSVALGNEPVRVGGEIARTRDHGGYGYTVGRSIAYAYLPPEHTEPGNRGGGRDLRATGSAGEVGARAAVRPGGRARSAPELEAAAPAGAARRGCARCPRGARASASPPARRRRAAAARRAGGAGRSSGVSTSSGWAMRAMRSLIWPWTSVIAVTSRGECAASASADVEAHVGAPVVLEVARLVSAMPVGEVLEPGEVVVAGALGGEHRGARLHRHAIVEHGAGLVAERLACLPGRAGAPRRRRCRPRDRAAR